MFTTIERMELDDRAWNWSGIAHFIFLGIVIGYVGSLLIWLSSQFIILKKASNWFIIKNQFVYVGTMAVIISS